MTALVMKDDGGDSISVESDGGDSISDVMVIGVLLGSGGGVDLGG